MHWKRGAGSGAVEPSPNNTSPLLSLHLEPPTLLSLLVVFRQTTTQNPKKDSTCMYLNVSMYVCVRLEYEHADARCECGRVCV